MSLFDHSPLSERLNLVSFEYLPRDEWEFKEVFNSLHVYNTFRIMAKISNQKYMLQNGAEKADSQLNFH